MFKSAGYRIGPGEIENCLVKHPAVANCAVVPKPDRERGALVVPAHFAEPHAGFVREENGERRFEPLASASV